MPGFRTGIRRIKSDINDLGNFQAPVAHDLEAFAVPRGIGNDVDCNIYVERAGILECFKIFGECDALSVTLQSLLVDCFKTKEHSIQAESLPKFEDLVLLLITSDVGKDRGISIFILERASHKC